MVKKLKIFTKKEIIRPCIPCYHEIIYYKKSKGCLYIEVTKLDASIAKLEGKL